MFDQVVPVSRFRGADVESPASPLPAEAVLSAQSPLEEEHEHEQEGAAAEALFQSPNLAAAPARAHLTRSGGQSASAMRSRRVVATPLFDQLPENAEIPGDSSVHLDDSPADEPQRRFSSLAQSTPAKAENVQAQRLSFAAATESGAPITGSSLSNSATASLLSPPHADPRRAMTRSPLLPVTVAVPDSHSNGFAALLSPSSDFSLSALPFAPTAPSTSAAAHVASTSATSTVSREVAAAQPTDALPPQAPPLALTHSFSREHTHSISSLPSQAQVASFSLSLFLLLRLISL